MSTNHSADGVQPPAWSHDDVVQILEHAALFFQASVSGLKNERLDEEPVVGEATVRDIVTHLAAWELEFEREAGHLARSQNLRFEYKIDVAPGCMLATAASHAPSAWEAEQRDKRRSMPTGAIFLELEQAQHRLLNFARQLAPRKLSHQTRFPWGRDGSLGDLLVTAASHKRYHAEAIREWRTGGHF